MSLKNSLTIALAGTAIGAGVGGKKGLELGFKIGLVTGMTVGILGTTIFVMGKNKLKEKDDLEVQESLN